MKKTGNILWVHLPYEHWIGISSDPNGLHIGCIHLLCASLLIDSLNRIHGKFKSLERDRQLRE
ncbi:MAG: hypothetical protein Q4G00_13550 [Clostridia bacterium]|nr:hypothetical protein [Clostridia bacterium]